MSLIAETRKVNAPGSPPDFETATSLRQKAFAAGLDPAYWYPVEWDRALRRQTVIEVKSGNTSIALYRSSGGAIHAVENRCAHRHVKLSHGFVEDCRLRCIYHGWTYAADGRLVATSQETLGRSIPSVQLRSFPVQVRYGLIWVFLGDTALASHRCVPRIPELEAEERWFCVAQDFLWQSRPTMIVNNFMDSTHVGSLHNRHFLTRSVDVEAITNCETDGDKVKVSYDIKVNRNGLFRVLGSPIKTNKLDAYYEYPYLWANLGGAYRLWTLMLPIDESTTRVFIFSLADGLKIPFMPFMAPAWSWPVLGRFSSRFLLTPLLKADGWSTEIEQEGYLENYARPCVDLHPAPTRCYELTVRKWQEHLARMER